MKTIDLPSGDQVPCEPLVTNFAAAPSRFITQASGKPLFSVVYRIRLPSGEKRGSASGLAPLVSCFAFRPLARIVQIFMAPLRSLTKTTVPFSMVKLSLPEAGGGAITGAGRVGFFSGSAGGLVLGPLTTTTGLSPAPTFRARRKP